MEAQPPDRGVLQAPRLRPGTAGRLVALIQRYGAAIEADLAWRGIDLATEWRSRRWRRLLNLIEHLPRNSAFMEAQANDEEVAERLADSLDLEDHPSEERLSEWSPERAALARVESALRGLIQAVYATTGNTPPRLAPVRHPVTALQRVKERRRYEHHKALAARLVRQSR